MLAPNSNSGVVPWPDSRTWPELLSRYISGSVACQILSLYDRPQPKTTLSDLPPRVNKLEAPDWSVQMNGGSSGGLNLISLLPQSGPKTAANALANMDSAKSLAAAELILKAGDASVASLVEKPEHQAKFIADVKQGRQLLFRLLSTSTKKAGTARSQLSFFASLPLHHPLSHSEVVERGSRATDLHGISCRLSSGLYSIAGEALEAMAADVRSCCNLWRSMNSSGTGMQANNWELGDEVEKTLEVFLEEVKLKQQNQPMAIDDGVKNEIDGANGELAAAGDGDGDAMEVDAVKEEKEGEEIGEVDFNAINDTSRPFLPLIHQGCRVCWGQDLTRLICQGCRDEYHLNCIDPCNLSNDLPEGDWFCSSCTTRLGNSKESDGDKGSQALAVGGTVLPNSKISKSCIKELREMLQMSEALRSKEYLPGVGGEVGGEVGTWTPSERIRLLAMLTEMVAESSQRLLQVVGENAMEIKKEAKKEMGEIRSKAKEREEAAKAKGQGPGQSVKIGSGLVGLSDKDKRKVGGLKFKTSRSSLPSQLSLSCVL